MSSTQARSLTAWCEPLATQLHRDEAPARRTQLGGAIVARELGIPCVINTVDGSRRLRTGDRVTVDGGAGSVRLQPQ
jgi:PEP-utilising enzyme, mobile domain